MPTAEDYLECHAIGHAWYCLEDQPLIKLLRCDRCTMKRLDKINLRGGLQDRQYDPPPGYSDERMPKRTKDEWRLLYFAQLKKKAKKGGELERMLAKKRTTVKKEKVKLKLITA